MYLKLTKICQKCGRKVMRHILKSGRNIFYCKNCCENIT